MIVSKGDCAVCEFLINLACVFGFMGASQLGLGCSWAFFYLGQGI